MTQGYDIIGISQNRKSKNVVHDAKCHAIKWLVATVYSDFATNLIGNFMRKSW